jgi:hypothetical protein
MLINIWKERNNKEHKNREGTQKLEKESLIER